MDLRFRLLLGLLSGGFALALAAAVPGTAGERREARSQPEAVRHVLAQAERSGGQHLSQFATPGARPQTAGRIPAAVLSLALLAMLAAVWLFARAWRPLRGLDRLRASLARSRARERRLRRDLLAVQETERHALARELHDEFGQSLAVMVSAAGYMERHAATASAQAMGECARDIRVAASQMARQVRGHLRRLHPQGLQDMDLRAALEELVSGHWLGAAGLDVQVRWPPVLPPLSPLARLALYRTLQEALTNVVRHAGANRVVLAFECGPGGLRVCIEDDGRGDARAALCSARSGVRGMRERAEMAHGRLALEPSALGGLRVDLWLPTGVGDEDKQGDEDHGERAAAG